MMRSGSQNWHRASQSDSSSPKVLNTDSQTIEEMVNSGKLTPLTSLQQLVDILPKADMWPQMISERENLTDSSEEIMRSGSQNWHRAGQSDSSYPKVLNTDSQTIEEMVNSGKLTPLNNLQQLVDILPKGDMWSRMASEEELDGELQTNEKMERPYYGDLLPQSVSGEKLGELLTRRVGSRLNEGMRNQTNGRMRNQTNTGMGNQTNFGMGNQKHNGIGNQTNVVTVNQTNGSMGNETNDGMVNQTNHVIGDQANAGNQTNGAMGDKTSDGMRNQTIGV